MVVCMCTCTCLPFNICIENYEHDLKIPVYISLSILTSIFLVQLTLTYQYLSEKKNRIISYGIIQHCVKEVN